MASEHEIQPHIGVVKLRFGMTKDEVYTILGPPEETDVHPVGEAYEEPFGSSVLTIYSKSDNTLVQIGFSRWTQGVTFKNMDFFNEDPRKVLEFLIQEDGRPLESLGVIVLLNLGITLTGFHIYGNQSVAFEAMDVFQTPGTEVIRRLSEAGGKPLETVGIVVFLKPGIAMTGFLQGDEPGQKSISVFAKGRWDSEIEDLKPFKMKKK